MSMRELARQIGVSDTHISRVVRRAEYKSASASLARKVGKVMGLPVGFFVEEREGLVLDRVRANAKLRDRLYDELTRRGRK